MTPAPITKARFDALCVARRVGAEELAPEYEWWSINNDQLIGTIILDLKDNDWTWVVLGRDEYNTFRAIDVESCIVTQQEASRLLQAALVAHAGTGSTRFPQGGTQIKGSTPGLLEPVVSEDRLAPHFKTLIRSPHYSAAAALLREYAPMFVDIDGNFVEQFQSTGFNARLWELYLDLMLRENCFHRTTQFDRPDFCVMKDGIAIGIEAVTVNPSEKHTLPESNSLEEDRKILEEFMPQRFGGPLTAKLRKNYWSLPHMTGVPLVIAIQDFFTEQSMTWSLGALRRYLYGLHPEPFLHADGTVDTKYQEIEAHTWGEKSIESGFFDLPDAEHVSAIIANPTATLSKFNRMGKEAGLGDPTVTMRRVGQQWDPDPKATKPIVFDYEVTASQPRERWSHGLVVFTNPNAKNPIPPDIFEAGEIHVMEDGRLIPYLRDGHIYASFTFVGTSDGSVTTSPA